MNFTIYLKSGKEMHIEGIENLEAYLIDFKHTVDVIIPEWFRNSNLKFKYSENSLWEKKYAIINYNQKEERYKMNKKLIYSITILEDLGQEVLAKVQWKDGMVTTTKIKKGDL